MFKSEDLPLIVEFFLMFYKDKPIDWLIDHLLWVKVCNPEKDTVSITEFFNEHLMNINNIQTLSVTKFIFKKWNISLSNWTYFGLTRVFAPSWVLGFRKLYGSGASSCSRICTLLLC